MVVVGLVPVFIDVLDVEERLNVSSVKDGAELRNLNHAISADVVLDIEMPALDLLAHSDFLTLLVDNLTLSGLLFGSV